MSYIQRGNARTSLVLWSGRSPLSYTLVIYVYLSAMAADHATLGNTLGAFLLGERLQRI